MKTEQKVSTGPVGGLYDPRFKYTRSEQTDIRKTIERERLRLAAAKAKKEEDKS